MTTAKMTTQGRVTIPIQIRKSLGINAGDKLKFFRSSGGKVFLLSKNFDVIELKGALPKPSETVYLERIEESVRQQGSDILGDDE